MGTHQGTELGQSHGPMLPAAVRDTGRVQSTGLSGTVTTVVMIAGLVVVLVLLIRQWRGRR
ncbi:hypothetical protein GCM10011594_36280 [Nakamurella endophytica]|uniref:Uncharacterized protein n=1 Tax=Nakamurella endophytica TaxID=1748367 RepID=A0A917T7V0_9ACTN|nr:hypothetical protein GCM10011594_36280 [Nakamurella endophytica]